MSESIITVNGQLRVTCGVVASELTSYYQNSELSYGRCRTFLFEG